MAASTWQEGVAPEIRSKTATSSAADFISYQEKKPKYPSGSYFLHYFSLTLYCLHYFF